MLLEKRKHIPPPEDLASKAGPAKKKRKRAKTPFNARDVEPTPDNPVVVEDDEYEASSESVEQVVDIIPLRTRFSGITIRKPEEGVPGPSLKKDHLGKGKQILGEEETLN